MDYLIFTYPNCSKCEKLKEYLSVSLFDWKEYNLVNKESKLKIRDYLSDIRRDKTGGIIIPTLIAEEEGLVAAVLNSKEELDDWLKSRG
jgi:glutaredoxin